MNSLPDTPDRTERRSGFDRRVMRTTIFSKYWLIGRRGIPRRAQDRAKPHVVEWYTPRTFAAVILLIVLSILDAIFTLELIGRGATELNPVMAFYLDWSPLSFVVIKYGLTCAAILLILFRQDHRIFQTRFRVKTLLLFFAVSYILTIQWQLYLILSKP